MSKKGYLIVSIVLFVVLAVTLGILLVQYAGIGEPEKKYGGMMQAQYDTEYESAKADADNDREVRLVLMAVLGIPLFLSALVFLILSAVAKPAQHY